MFEYLDCATLSATSRYTAVIATPSHKLLTKCVITGYKTTCVQNMNIVY